MRTRGSARVISLLQGPADRACNSRQRAGPAHRTAPHPPATQLAAPEPPPRPLECCSAGVGWDFITVTARDWPDASVVGAAAPRCRFGSMHAVPATVIAAGDSRVGRRGEVKLVCTSPNFHRAQHHAAGSKLGDKSRHRGSTYDGRHTQPQRTATRLGCRSPPAQARLARSGSTHDGLCGGA